jgi:lipopolysaccharide export LptBFGC system permease protein LptF
MGLGFLLETAYLFPLMVLSLMLAVFALGFRAKRRRGYGPLWVGLLAAGFMLSGNFLLGLTWLTYSGIALLLAASVWNSWPMNRRAMV